MDAIDRDLRTLHFLPRRDSRDDIVRALAGNLRARAADKARDLGPGRRTHPRATA